MSGIALRDFPALLACIATGARLARRSRICGGGSEMQAGFISLTLHANVFPQWLRKSEKVHSGGSFLVKKSNFARLIGRVSPEMRYFVKAVLASIPVSP